MPQGPLLRPHWGGWKAKGLMIVVSVGIPATGERQAGRGSLRFRLWRTDGEWIKSGLACGPDQVPCLEIASPKPKRSSKTFLVFFIQPRPPFPEDRLPFPKKVPLSAMQNAVPARDERLRGRTGKPTGREERADEDLDGRTRPDGRRESPKKT